MYSLQSLNYLNLHSLLDSLISLAFAFLLGGLIGLERQYRQRTAGLRTNVLVSVGAALFVILENRLGGADGSMRVLANIVTGIGFLGAGVIMREAGNVRGLNTAATLWCSAAVGAAAGSSLILEAILGCIFVLIANTLLRPIVNAIHRQPLDIISTEVTNTIHVIVHKVHRKEVLAMVESELERCFFHIQDLDIHKFSEDEIEIQATLAATSVNGAELDDLVKRLALSPSVVQVFWQASTAH